MNSTTHGFGIARLHGRDGEGRPLIALPTAARTAPTVLLARLAVAMTDDEYDALAADAAQVLVVHAADSRRRSSSGSSATGRAAGPRSRRRSCSRPAIESSSAAAEAGSS